MRLSKTTSRGIALLVGYGVIASLAACGQSAADKQAADVAAMRATMERDAAEKKAEAEKADADNKKRMAELKAQAASDAKSMGWSK